MPWSSSPSQSTCLFCFVLIPLFPGQFSYPEASHTRWQSYSPADDDSHHRHTISHNGWTSANTGSLNDTVPEQSVSAMVKDPLSFVVVSHPIIVSCLAKDNNRESVERAVHHLQIFLNGFLSARDRERDSLHGSWEIIMEGTTFFDTASHVVACFFTVNKFTVASQEVLHLGLVSPTSLTVKT